MAIPNLVGRTPTEVKGNARVEGHMGSDEGSTLGQIAKKYHVVTKGGYYNTTLEQMMQQML